MTPELVKDSLARGQWYTVVLHHRSDDMVDIFLDGVFVTRKPALTGAGLPTYISIGDGSGSISADYELDYVSAGYPAGALIPLAVAKTRPNGATVSVQGMVTAVFDGYFYIESEDRASGIRVTKTGYTATVGKKASVSGPIATDDATAERYIDGTSVSETAGTTLAPLAMTNKATGGGASGVQQGVAGAAGLNNIGLFVRTSGKVSNVSGDTFTLDDGSGVALTDMVQAGQHMPSNGAYITVTGVNSCQIVGTDVQRLLLVTSWQ